MNSASRSYRSASSRLVSPSNRSSLAASTSARASTPLDRVNDTGANPLSSAPTGLAVGLALRARATPQKSRRFAPGATWLLGSPLSTRPARGDSAGLVCWRGQSTGRGRRDGPHLSINPGRWGLFAPARTASGSTAGRGKGRAPNRRSCRSRYAERSLSPNSAVRLRRTAPATRRLHSWRAIVPTRPEPTMPMATPGSPGLSVTGDRSTKEGAVRSSSMPPGARPHSDSVGHGRSGWPRRQHHRPSSVARRGLHRSRPPGGCSCVPGLPKGKPHGVSLM
jgi:hypothetical protein